MKKIFVFAAVAALFAACSSDDLTLDNQPQVQLEKGAVGFDAYLQRTTTRGGLVGDVVLDNLKSNGFGVFGYYTDNRDYDQLATPNFFYNQEVTYQSTPAPGYWDYSPVKYWPNEYGNDAISEDADRVSYFAYAPYTPIDINSGKVNPGSDNNDTWGITSMTRNTGSGDPIIKYIASFDSKHAVDLCWGVVPNEPAYTTWQKVSEHATQNFTAGKPWVDVQRPGQTDQRVKFQFKHALAKMQVTIDYLADIYQETGSNPTLADDGKTRIWIRSVRFSGFTMQGALNLNNEDAGKPYWMNYNGIGDLVSDGQVTLYDGRKDGKEGQADAVATNEKSVGLDPNFIQDEKQITSGTWATSGEGARTGVTNTAKNLFLDTSSPKSGIFYVIPTDDDLEIEIVYDVETISENLAGTLADGKTHGSSVENRIMQKITFGNGEKALMFGKAYSLKLHLGMNSVKFDADVLGWDDMEPLDIDLPSNLAKWAAGAPGSGPGDTDPATAITIPYVQPTSNVFTFGITGLNGGESVVATAVSNKWNSAATTAPTEDGKYVLISGESRWVANSTNALSNGTFVATLQTDENPTTSNRTQIVTWKGQQSNQMLVVTFTQLAHPLNLYAGASYGAENKASISSHKITLKRAAGITTTWGWFCKGLAENCAALTASSNGDPEATNPTNGIRVYRNGKKLELVDTFSDPAVANEYKFTDASGEIEFKEDPKPGDIIKVVLKTGDAPVETITITVI